MKIYTIGFTGKTAEQFFELLAGAGIWRLIDARISNKSQLAGFTRKSDLPFFLKKIADIEYLHEPLLAPTKELMNSWRNKKIDWPDFEKAFLALMKERGVEKALDKSLFKSPTVLLCSEAGPEHCHRRLAAEYLKSRWGDVEIVHLR